MYHCK
jgi:sterol carrier protein 2